MNALVKPVGHEHTAVNTLSSGDITMAGLEALQNSLTRRRTEDMGLSAVRAAAGMSQEKEAARSEKDIAREKLVNTLVKSAAPERMFQLICAGVASRNPETGKSYIYPNTGYWAAQGVVNQVCRMAALAYIERSRETGIVEGVDFNQDDARFFTGLIATNTDTMGAMRGGQRSSENPFLQHCDDRETIEATFLNWYEEIETPLSALAGAAMMQDDSMMLYGHYSTWEDAVGGIQQRIYSLSDYIEREMLRQNSRDRRPEASPSELAKLFG